MKQIVDDSLKDLEKVSSILRNAMQDLNRLWLIDINRLR